VTVHDLIGLVYPQNVGAASRFYWSVWLPQALKRADRLVAISESTRRDIERFLKIPSQRVDLVPSAIRPHFRLLEDSARARRVLDRYDLSRPYFISVSTLEPRKNLLSLLRAYKKLRAKTKDPMLVLAGKPGGAEAELAAYIKENGLENDVKLLGYVTDEDVICLYNGALGFAMVSLYEGFGLPALEAMACGLTGVVSNASSLPEVVGQGAILVDPINVNEIAEGLFALCGNGSDKTELVRAARARAEDFSIEKVARAMIEIFKKEAGK
jgi:glycosyltransferase involved in cell wall biosynthesis